MKILYVGCFCEPSQENFIYNRAKAKVTISATTFQKAFLKGFIERVPDYIINIPDIGSFPLRCKLPWVPSSQFEYNSIKGRNCAFLNVTYVKRYSIYYSIKRNVEEWILKNKDRQIIIVVYSLIYSYIKAVVDIKKKYSNVHICCIVLDLPQYFDDNISKLNVVDSSIMAKKIYSVVPQIDSYVLLTQEMKFALNIGNRPCMLMEGIYQPQDIPNVKKELKTILYTGKLDARFGIRDLLHAFTAIPDPDFTLWICGDGLDREYVESYSRQDKRVKYWGLVKQQEAFIMQKKATLLVNPRKGDAEYTKFSFPSKTLEYMASGTPTIMYKLPGLPKEYEEHLVLLADKSIESLTKTLLEWGTKSLLDLNDFGNSARNFILENKTSSVQIKRFVEFITNIG